MVVFTLELKLVVSSGKRTAASNYGISINLNQLHFISIFDISHQQCEITVHVTQHDTKVIDIN